MSDKTRLDKWGFWPCLFCFGNRQVGNVGGILSPSCLSRPLFLHKQINREVILTIWKKALWLSHMPGKEGLMARAFPLLFLHTKNAPSTSVLHRRIKPFSSWVLYLQYTTVPPGESVLPRGTQKHTESLHLYLANSLSVMKLQFQFLCEQKGNPFRWVSSEWCHFLYRFNM